MRECSEYEITIEKLIKIVHNYTDPIRIAVVMGDAWLTCAEAKHMRDFVLTEHLTPYDKEENERLMKYYKDVPVCNLTAWTKSGWNEGRCLCFGIEARCQYKDIRDGWLAEQRDKKMRKRREYMARKRAEKVFEDGQTG